MILPLLSVLFGLVMIVWSADRFVDGSASTARYLGMPPLLIGMIVVGFGTSAPEIAVSALASYQGNPGMGLGNAYGSNIANIALVLGLTAMIHPVTVHSRILRKELPILTAVTALAAFQVWDGWLTLYDALVLLTVFMGLIVWTILEGLQHPADALASEAEQELQTREMPLDRALFWLVVGLFLLVASSRLLVWGAVEIAQGLGVSDLVIGLTVVAVGTSLPELASAVIATRKGEHDIALGNVLGSNLFNTLAVAGIAVAIQPTAVPPEVFSRDMFVMGGLTLSLFALCYGFQGPGRVNRFEGAALLTVYIGYTAYLVSGILQ